MASHTAVFSVGPKTLSTTTVDTVTLDSFELVDVHNLTGATSLTVTAGRGTPATPVAGANDNYVIPAGRSRTIVVSGSADAAAVVKVLGNGNVYLVEGVG